MAPDSLDNRDSAPDKVLSTADRLVESLQRPTAYGHAANDIKLLETHISWVVLAGDYAYKLKKPVDLGFVDFTTLERRKRFCEEEIRLNSRLAPQLYLGVSPIAGTVDRPRIEGDGPPIEYAVKMRRFPQESLLVEVLKRGLLAPCHIDELAQELAEFHAKIPHAPPESSFGDPDHVWRPMEENLQAIEREPESGDAAKRLRTWAETEFAARRESFVARKAGGFVRECHGDMHLGNMLLWDGKVTIFDCIEFCEDFRWVDVACELAFAVMDLEDRGRDDLSHQLLNSYLERTGDYAGLAVFRFYFVYLALVRAKVALIRFRQGHLEEVQRQRLLKEFRGYLQLAARQTGRPAPRLTITFGPSGSGKTTATQPILESLGAVRLRSDLERKRLFGLKPLDRSQHDLSAGIYAADATDKTYERLANLARLVVKAGFSAIVDATFLTRARRAVFRRLAEDLKVPFSILECQAPPEVLRERIVRRAKENKDASDADLRVLDRQLATMEALDDVERALRE